jgi:hypothetical protein
MSEPDATASLCVACVAQPPYWPSYLCGGCYARLRGDLATVAWAYGWLGATMLSLGTAWKPGTIHRAGGSRPPFEVQLHDAREEIRLAVTRWGKRIGEQHEPAIPGPADWSVHTVGRWMQRHTQWCSDQPWCADLMADLAELRTAASALSPWQRARRDMPFPCPRCNWLSLSLYTGSDGITCRNRACGAPMTWADYEKRVTDWYETYLRESDAAAA